MEMVKTKVIRLRYAMLWYDDIFHEFWYVGEDP
jgi:hypothetical protein